MASPLLPDLSAAPLQAMSRAAMRHRVTLATPQSRDAGHGGETEELDPLLTGPFPCLLMMGGAHVAEIAAARGVKADGTLRLPLGVICTAGQQATVTGTIQGRAWTRVLDVTSGADETNRVFGLAMVVDVNLNR